tara:strand:+ start:968 stop:1810 length:843 start_codon:yes stop_codon:yes gene_type:complete
MYKKKVKEELDIEGAFIDWDFVDEHSWRNALKAFLDIGTFYVLNFKQIEPDNFFLEEYYESTYRENLSDFFSKLYPESKIEFDKIDSLTEAYDLLNGTEFEKKCFHIRLQHTLLGSTLNRLEGLGLISSERLENIENIKEFIVPSDSFCFTKYTLTEKGVDVSIKLVEHDDNKKKDQQQLQISEQLKSNSTITVRTSIFASFVAACALILSFLNYQLLDQRLELMKLSSVEKSDKKLRAEEQEHADAQVTSRLYLKENKLNSEKANKSSNTDGEKAATGS